MDRFSLTKLQKRVAVSQKILCFTNTGFSLLRKRRALDIAVAVALAIYWLIDRSSISHSRTQLKGVYLLVYYNSRRQHGCWRRLLNFASTQSDVGNGVGRGGAPGAGAPPKMSRKIFFHRLVKLCTWFSTHLCTTIWLLQYRYYYCHYCLNCTKFGQLILRKIIKIVATRCHILRLKCTKFDFGWGSAPDTAGGAYSAPPDPLAGLRGPTSKF